MESTTSSNIIYAVTQDDTKLCAKSSIPKKRSFPWDSDDDDLVVEKPQKKGFVREDKIDGLVDEMQ